MFPYERSLVEKLKDEPFALLGVNSDRDLEAIRKTVIEKNLTWRSFWNGEEGTRGPISSAWNVKGWPTVYLIDAEGRIRHKKIHGDEEITAALEVLIAEAKKPAASGV